MSGTAGATTLSTPQIPSHTHGVTSGAFVASPGGPNIVVGANYVPAFTQNTGATGGGGSHDHPFSFSSGAGTVNLAIKYVDLIIAQKD
jgi:hypothetical protein